MQLITKRKYYKLYKIIQEPYIATENDYISSNFNNESKFFKNLEYNRVSTSKIVSDGKTLETSNQLMSGTHNGKGFRYQGGMIDIEITITATKKDFPEIIRYCEIDAPERETIISQHHLLEVLRKNLEAS